MRIYAFVGPSGTGKSHNSQNVAFENNIEYIIDDALLIKGNKVVAGRSAKTEPTKIGSVKAALFTDESRRDLMRKAIKAEKIQSILILGTSDEMVEKIAENLGLPEIEKKIYIEQVSSAEQIEEAKKIRKEQGKHVVPVPTFEIKEQFSGYFVDQLKMFEKKDKVYREKSVIRPTFSYLGNFTISDSVFRQITEYLANKVPSIYKILKLRANNSGEGPMIYMEVMIVYGFNVAEELKAFKEKVKKEIEQLTSMNVVSIEVIAKSIYMPEE